MGVGILLAFVGLLCTYSAHRGQKRALEPLELELQKVESVHVGAGNQTWVPSNLHQCTLAAKSTLQAPISVIFRTQYHSYFIIYRVNLSRL